MLWRAAGSAVLVMPVPTGDPVLLTDGNARVWHLLEEPATTHELLAALGGGEPANVETFLERLRGLGVLDRMPA